MKKLLGLAALFLLASPAFAQSKLDTPASHVQKEEQMLPPVVVTAAPYPAGQFDRIGPYNQPVWSTTRMFPSTRAYVMTPPGAVKYEKWFDFRDRRDGPTQIRMRDEIAIGLGNRLELDLYAHTVYDGPSDSREFNWRGFSWEIRYALADWGKIPGNPTLYFEHKMINGREGIEPKLLLSDRVGETDWIWAANLIYEANLASTKAEQEREYAVTASLGKVYSNNLMVGGTAHYRTHDYDTNVKELYFGPAINWRVSPEARLSFEYMPRITSQGYYDSRSFMIFAYDLK